MQGHSHLLIAAALAATLLTACGERAENEPAGAAPAGDTAASETAATAEAPGTTTNFEESAPSEEQTQSPSQ